LSKEIQALIGAIFMGVGAYFLAYSHGERIWGKPKKAKRTRPEGFYDPKTPQSSERRNHILKSIMVGVAIAIMFFFYFYMR